MTDPDWRHLPPLSTLRAFEATARLEGYSAAARALNVTPAAIAQQVRKLEDEMGAALVRREGRGLVLTEAGRQLAAPLREAFALMAAGVNDLRNREAARGLRVSTTDFFVDAVILPRLRDFWEKHPGVEIAFSPEGNRAPIDLDAFDLVVRGNLKGETWGNLNAVPLIHTPLILCAAPSLVGDGRVDATTFPWLRDRSMVQSVFDEAVRRAGCDPDQVRIVDPGNVRLEIEAALMGYGLSLSSEIVVRKYLADGSLVLVDCPLDMWGVFSVITRKGPLRENTQRFLDWLIAICEPLSYRPGA